jgi:tetratricopeptide repeat protein 21B
MIYISNGTKASVLKASEISNDIFNQNPLYAPAVVMMASAKIAENNGTRSEQEAREILRSLQKIPYQPEFADDFEKGWLMSADLAISQDQYPIASDLLSMCLRYNASCGKAEELTGLIKEKESQFDDSSFHYENAWKLSNRASASIGFRLALNYLKA